MFKTVDEHFKRLFLHLEGKLIAALATDSTKALFRASEMFNKHATRRKDGTERLIWFISSKPKRSCFKHCSHWLSYLAGKINQLKGLTKENDITSSAVFLKKVMANV